MLGSRQVWCWWVSHSYPQAERPPVTHLLQEGTPPIHRGLNTQIFEPMEVVLIQTRIPPPLCCLLSFLISYLKKKKSLLHRCSCGVLCSVRALWDSKWWPCFCTSWKWDFNGRVAGKTEVTPGCLFPTWVWEIVTYMEILILEYAPSTKSIWLSPDFDNCSLAQCSWLQLFCDIWMSYPVLHCEPSALSLSASETDIYMLPETGWYQWWICSVHKHIKPCIIKSWSGVVVLGMVAHNYHPKRMLEGRLERWLRD